MQNIPVTSVMFQLQVDMKLWALLNFFSTQLYVCQDLICVQSNKSTMQHRSTIFFLFFNRNRKPIVKYKADILHIYMCTLCRPCPWVRVRRRQPGPCSWMVFRRVTGSCYRIVTYQVPYSLSLAHGWSSEGSLGHATELSPIRYRDLTRAFVLKAWIRGPSYIWSN